MKLGHVIIIFLATPLFLFRAGDCFAQLKDEKEAEQINKLTKDVIQHKKSKTNLKQGLKQVYTSIDIAQGYESNPQLAQTRKGDFFQEELFSLSYVRPLGHQFKARFSYHLDAWQYNEITDLNNILNHVRAGLERTLGEHFTVGGGYDFAALYYPNSDSGDNIFNKGYFFIKHNISKRIYQQLTFEGGRKDYGQAKALGEGSSTLLDKRRQDKRFSEEYVLGFILNKRMTLRFRAKYTLNDSNAQYQDFYDSKALDFSTRLSYKFTKQISSFGSLAYTRRYYGSRNISSGNDKERDGIYASTIGVQYMLSPSNTISTSYAYRQAYSNDPTARYSDSTITCGLRHEF